MMTVTVPREYDPEETRVPLIPPDVKALIQRGAPVEIESGMGSPSGYSDGEYRTAGAKVVQNRKALISSGDIILRVSRPPLPEIEWQKPGSVHISYFDPFNEPELLDAFLSRGIKALSMEMIPRITRAQKMDALSSQASLSGYVAVILAAERLHKIFPMMMTPAGTIAPVRVFVIGAGVAGLQAIATARRLGARIEAFDTRAVVEEEVRSLGAKFVKIDLGETGQTRNGYAKSLTAEQLELQRREIAKYCATADVVITTAQVFGKKAPLIVTRAMIEAMKMGSVVVDLAAESGGNVEGSVPGQEVVVGGVTLVGLKNPPGHVSVHASQMYSRNVTSLILEFWDDETKEFTLPLEDEIIRGCLVTHDHAIFSETLRTVMKEGEKNGAASL
ncbi:MAG: NAD(P) transhydrogenase subunit alpha [Syntrophales bacterium]|nr:NAD(P) transhydrogenase subunit alpha [Syntrophales bacterium]